MNRTEQFNDYYPSMKKNDYYCNMLHVHKWMTLFVFIHNAIIQFDINPSKINDWLGGE